MTTTTIKIEHTDTFGGESNYSWVRCYEETTSTPLTQRQIVRIAKRLTGLTGIPCRVTNYGDMLDIRPYRICQVVFVSFDYD